MKILVLVLAERPALDIQVGHSNKKGHVRRGYGNYPVLKLYLVVGV